MSAARIAVLPLVAACLLAGCGGGDDNAKGPPGSESNPLVALPNPSATRTPPNEQPAGETGATKRGASAAPGGVSKPSKSTRTQHGSVAKKPARHTGETAAGTRPKTARKQKAGVAVASQPCLLVTKTQAKEIVGAPILEPLQAPQGPTCIYRTKSRKTYITLAVQTVDFAKLRKQIRNARSVSIASRTAYCGTYGKPMLFLPVAGGRVLSIAAPCGTAQRFAAKAAPHL
jgi:hypothetical protein